MGRPIRSLFSTLFIIRNFPRPRNASLYIFAVMKQKWSPRPPLKRTIKAASVYFEIFLLSFFIISSLHGDRLVQLNFSRISERE